MKSKTLYIHAGMPKTGTSALQAFFALNAQKLSQKGLHYPFQEAFNQPFQTSSGNALALSSFTRDKENETFQYIKKLQDFLDQADGDTLLSTESLFNPIRTKKHAHFLKDNLPDCNTKIILYLRRQDNFLESASHQLVKNHFATSITYNRVFNYKEILDTISSLWGRENIIVRPYEKKQFKGDNGIYSDFFNAISLDIDFKKCTMPEKRVNPSLSAGSFFYKAHINTLIKYRSDKKALSDRFNKHLIAFDISENATHGLEYSDPTNSREMLSPTKRKAIINQFTESNKAVAQQYLKQEDLFLNPLNESASWESPFGLSDKKIVDRTIFIGKEDKELILIILQELLRKARLPESSQNHNNLSLLKAIKEALNTK
ncbi:MAG: hypothetical protein ACTSXQ_01085 [Alphaproteobacteria bacterium]